VCASLVLPECLSHKAEHLFIKNDIYRHLKKGITSVPNQTGLECHSVSGSPLRNDESYEYEFEKQGGEIRKKRI